MKYGVSMFPTDFSIRPDELAVMAEERGFESFWVPEHTHIPVNRESPWPSGGTLPERYYHALDPFAALTAAAAVTSRLKVGTSVCLVIERDPIILAKEVASVDYISNGRFLFGIGGGWNAEEMADHGTAFRTRWRVLRERILAMKEIWTQDEAEYHGQYVNFDKIWSWPKPVQKPHPPILMGGDGATTFDRVIEYCDGWLPIPGRRNEGGSLLDKVGELKSRAKAACRDPDSIDVTVYSLGAEMPEAGPLEAAGVSRIIFSVPSAPRAEVEPILDQHAKLV